MSSNPKVTVLIVNYNGKPYLGDCLSSICDTDYSNFEVVVVDSASSDGSVEFIKERFPGILLIESHENRGLGAGINLGIKHALGKRMSYVVFINTDTVVDKRWIKEAVRVAENDSLIGILGFAEFGDMTRTTYQDFLEAQQNFSKIEISYPFEGPGTLPFFMIRAMVFEELGLFDEKYFAYGDDNDFEWRVIRAGFRLAKINVPCFHKGMGSFKPYSLLAARLVMRNVLRLHLVHSSPGKCFQILKMLFNYACNPFLIYDEKDIQFRRFRPSDIFTNFLLFIYGICWNVYNLPKSLAVRRNTTRIVNLANERLRQNAVTKGGYVKDGIAENAR